MAEVKDPRGIGSPPHTWRILILHLMWERQQGITSTYVENTNSVPYSMYVAWDHLHTRGEYPWSIVPACTIEGSPPHSWRILNDPRYINISQSK